MITDGAGQFEDWDKKDESVYQLRLFVAGTSSVSVRAISNLKNILEEYLPNKYELEIIDVYQHQSLAITEDIAAVPMLVKELPAPKRMLIGDMSDTEKVLRGLGLK